MIAAVKVVLPWSTWPIVPMLTCGFDLSNFSFAILFVVYLRLIFYLSYISTNIEPATRVELVTPSLPRKCSTTELRRLSCLSGRRGSNPLPKAWKAFALPNELLPHCRGGGWTRTTELIRGQIYSLLQLPLCDSPRKPFFQHSFNLSRQRDLDPRPRDYKSRALPLSYAGARA